MLKIRFNTHKLAASTRSQDSDLLRLGRGVQPACPKL
jgi:hypothetical protein